MLTPRQEQPTQEGYGGIITEGTTTPANNVRQIEVFAEASAIENWRQQVIAGQPDAGRFAFVSDEGKYMPGGEGTAPTPLSYFVAGMAL